MEATDREYTRADVAVLADEVARRLRAEVLALHMGEDHVIDEAEAAEYLRISVSKIRRLRASGELAAMKIGGSPRYSVGTLRDFIRRKMREGY